MVEDEIFDQSVSFIRDGDVVRSDGKTMRLRDIIKRRWGWPKSASSVAADYIRGSTKGVDPIVWVKGINREEQQMDVLLNAGGAMSKLLEGLARGSSKESGSKPISGVSVVFDGPEIYDDGLVTDVVKSLACRLGMSMPDIRDITLFSRDEEGVVRLVVNVWDLNET